jgi:CMP/dCMP kinase
MANQRSITISGDLASGKSTVAAELSSRMGLRRVIMGNVYRSLALSRGMSAIQLNRRSQRDAAVDAYVDNLQRDLANADSPLILDSRLGWYFLTDAFKVHLKIDPAVAAQRALKRRGSAGESYASLSEARASLFERSENERMRFIQNYGVDKTRLRNYDLVCDTTSATPSKICDIIIDVYRRQGGSAEVTLLLDPIRVYPTHVRTQIASTQMPHVAYARPHFFAVSGEIELSNALESGAQLIQAKLLGEEGEELWPGMKVRSYFESHVRRHISAWV